MASRWLVDGVPVDSCPNDDRGLAYGDGVFRTLRVSRARPVAWPEHMTKLAEDCRRLGLAPPDAHSLWHDARQLIDGRQDGVLKIMATRGSGGRGYTPAPVAMPRRIVSIHELPAHALDQPAPLVLDWSPIALARQPRLAGIKHLNRLEQVLARDDCQRRGTVDAAMHDSDGWLIATTMRNLLLRDIQGQWWTPRLDQAGVAGVTRQRLMRALAASGHPVTERAIAADALTTFDTAIACNSIGGVAPVTRIGQASFAHSEQAASDCRVLLEKL